MFPSKNYVAIEDLSPIHSDSNLYWGNYDFEENYKYRFLK